MTEQPLAPEPPVSFRGTQERHSRNGLTTRQSPLGRFLAPVATVPISGRTCATIVDCGTGRLSRLPQWDCRLRPTTDDCGLVVCAPTAQVPTLIGSAEWRSEIFVLGS